MSAKHTLYTVYITERKTVTLNGVSTERDVLAVYYDVTWNQVGFYKKKHVTDHVSCEAQARKLDKMPETHVLEDISYRAATIENSKNGGRPQVAAGSIPGGGTKKIDWSKMAKPSASPKASTPRAVTGGDYADLVNAMVAGE